MSKIQWTPTFIKTYHSGNIGEGGSGGYDIYNWRFIFDGSYARSKNDHIRGVYIFIRDVLIFIPYVDIDKISEINRMGDGHTEKRYHITMLRKDSPCMCYKCKCYGKFDWISKLTGHATHSLKDFKRDESHILIYKDMSKQFAQVKLKEGETYCPKCHGTGVSLDARQTIFKGMRGLRKNLTRIDI